MWWLLIVLLSVPPAEVAMPTAITDPDFIKEVVDAHNLHRSNVIPPAKRMLYMSWDPDLAKNARAWISRCKMQHNIYLQSRHRNHPVFLHVGENLFSGSFYNATFAINLWVGEIKDYDYNTHVCNPGKMCGHYTQVVWDNSYKVGCAGLKCGKSYIFCCSYGPPGNYPRRPYQTGIPCSDCPNESCKNKLCMNPEREKIITTAGPQLFIHLIFFAKYTALLVSVSGFSYLCYFS
ncbi:glioma pathogenesis-related protein 1 isoform X2 [Ascaphus truei]|uniref:glioma pathogenesis-related protein 1 isoform X2 n=1 Tax=Ascaphus truei TaxID=8439 RepID=UPI003F59D8B0